jgi:magnesium transporter
MLTASAMGYFENEIEKAVVLALFVPLIISSGGNSGSQAASLIIRALALGELRLKNWWYVMRKEIFSGLTLGSILGLVGLARIIIWQLAGLHDYGEYWIWIAIVVALSLIFVVLWGTLSGSMIPILLKRIGLDPATASAPFVATLVDVTGLVIYFSIAVIILGGKIL